ncbi:MAG: radical SAM protein [Candidatus Omnitrophota bacterium]
MGCNKKYNVLSFSTGCGNYCIFCFHKDEPDKGYNESSLTKLKNLIRSNKKNKVPHLLLAANEPLRYPGILELLEFANTCGFKTIETISSGEFFSDHAFTEKLLGCGLRNISIPIYGINKLHNKIVANCKSYRLLRSGMDNLRAHSGVKIYPHTLLLKQNIAHLDRIIGLCAKVTKETLSILHLKYKAKLPYKNLMPSYKEIVAKFRNSDLNFIGYPLCVLKELSPKRFARIVSCQKSYNENLLLKTDDTISDAIFLYSRVFSYHKLRKCVHCQIGQYCPGVFLNHIYHYGDSEIKPL